MRAVFTKEMSCVSLEDRDGLKVATLRSLSLGATYECRVRFEALTPQCAAGICLDVKAGSLPVFRLGNFSAPDAIRFYGVRTELPDEIPDAQYGGVDLPAAQGATGAAAMHNQSKPLPRSG
jgi:hypothetical protein